MDTDPTPRRDRDSNLDREVLAHLELEAEQQQRAGLPADEAGNAVKRQFGSVLRAKEAVRQEWAGSAFEAIGRELCQAARMQSRSPTCSCGMPHECWREESPSALAQPPLLAAC